MIQEQQDGLAVLSEIWQWSPDVHLGQRFAHLGFLGEVYVGRGFGYIEDDELIAVMYRHRSELLARAQGLPNESLQPTGAAVSVSSSSTASVAPAAER
jgi:hypothetical protein